MTIVDIDFSEIFNNRKRTWNTKKRITDHLSGRTFSAGWEERHLKGSYGPGKLFWWMRHSGFKEGLGMYVHVLGHRIEMRRLQPLINRLLKIEGVESVRFPYDEVVITKRDEVEWDEMVADINHALAPYL